MLLAAQAMALEETDADKALATASEAHGLAPDLIPAAAVAGRILASRGQTARAAKIIHKTWARAPHPDLAAAYAYARIGDSPSDRFDRIRQLARIKPFDVESGLAVAAAAIEARQYDAARHALQPFLKDGLTRRVARMMARLEAEEHGDTGRAREWLGRAATAKRDRAWTADGLLLDTWAPVSPLTGALDSVVWSDPVSSADEERPAAGGDAEPWLATIDGEGAEAHVKPMDGGIVPAAPLAAPVAPDDPGADGDGLEPEIRTTRTPPAA